MVCGGEYLAFQCLQTRCSTGRSCKIVRGWVFTDGGWRRKEGKRKIGKKEKKVEEDKIEEDEKEEEEV